MLGWLTKNSIPSDRVEYVLSLPNDETWRADFLGALFLLTQPQNWELDQGLTPQEMADEWEKVFYDFNEGVYNLIPIGCYMPFGGSSIPGGWLLCDGQAVSRATYANLFSVIGVVFGSGNGSTTFNVPNLKGKVSVGLDSSQTEFDALGETGGSKTHTLTTAQLASHNHTQDTHNHTQTTHNHTQDTHNHTQIAHSHTEGGHSHTRNAAGDPETVFHGTPASGSQGATATGNRLLINATLTGVTSPTTNTTTPTNQTTVATNQTTVATNQTTVATNQTTGSGTAHNNLQPYLVTNYIIKY